MARAFSTVGDRRLEQWLVTMIGAMDTDNYRSQANATFAFAFNGGDRLHEITVPSTVVWGALDAMFPVFVARIIQQAIPHATLRIVEGSGHFVNLEASETFNAILAEVLGLPAPIAHLARDTIRVSRHSDFLRI
jgi:pimeloyl-ACP methyl ester carboxylesterase